MEPNANGATPPANGGDGNNANNTPPAGNTPPATGTATATATPPAQGDSNNGGGGDLQLTPEQLEAAFKHPRFKELNDRAKLADKLKADQEAAERKRLEDAGEHQKLAEQYRTEAETARTALETERKNNAIIIEANKLGAHDPMVVTKLIDAGAITINEDGTVQGAEAAIKSLQTSNPYLFKTGTSKSMGGGDTNPGAGTNNAEFTYSQFKDSKFYQEHQKEMDKALVENRVDMTR